MEAKKCLQWFDYACMNMHRKMTVLMEAATEGPRLRVILTANTCIPRYDIWNSHTVIRIPEEVKNNKQRHCIFSSSMPVPL